MQGTGQLPEEALPSCPQAGAPRPLQELLQAGAGLDTSGPVEATQGGAWGVEGEREGEASPLYRNLTLGSPEPALPSQATKDDTAQAHLRHCLNFPGLVCLGGDGGSA